MPETPRGLEGRGRVVIEGVCPEIDGGRFPIKRVVGEPVVVGADVFADGHDVVRCVLRHRAEGEREWAEVPMAEIGNDRFTASFTPTEVGVHRYTIEGWIDHFGTWQRDLARRARAGQDVVAELEAGALLLEEAAARAGDGGDGGPAQWASRLRSGLDPCSAVELALGDAVAAAAARFPDRAHATTYAREPAVVVNRVRARFSTWYELFPRSAAGEGRHGTLADVEGRLAAIAGMGFDVVYLPPIHPIGETKRKGPDNSPVARPGDPGSPWGIGSSEGGHTALHPELGTLEDFRRLVAAAADHGLEIAIDIAFQCSPDHPWVAEHPAWFRHRPDGTIRYAENPPKRYEDIYPLNFESEDWWGLWQALRDVVLHWLDQGVRIFRVDNPHTKPFPFWEWLIGEVRQRCPDVIFLSEAFTRPKVMQRLAKLGFDQSYTYFTWRNSTWELREYFTELAQGPSAEYFRPNVWPNTPDILSEYLQDGGRPAFVIRLVLAATLGASYGIYGPAFELCESEPRERGSEEYRGSEKYEIRRWELDRPGNLSELVARVNAIRHAHPALQQDRTLAFHAVDNDQILCYSKTADGGAGCVVCVVGVDPYHRQSGWVELDLDLLGIGDEPFQVDDVLGGTRYVWHGPRNYVELDPQVLPAHVFVIRRAGRTEKDFDYYL